MPQPRRVLPEVAIQALYAAYSLGEPAGQELVYEGTSSLYRMTGRTGTQTRAVAVKVQDAGATVPAAKSLELDVLDALRTSFPTVPTLLRPHSAPSIETREWGLILDRFAVSVYKWVGNLEPWRGTVEQRRATVAGLARMQAGLNAIRVSGGVANRAQYQPTVLDSRIAGFSAEFEHSEQHRRRHDPGAGLDRATLADLDDRLRRLARTFASEWRRLAASTGLVHADFTPGNTGYAADGGLAIVYDFESVRPGVLPLFGALAAGAFALDHDASAPGVATAMAEVADGLRRHCPSLSPAAGQLLPLLRLGYLDAVWRQLRARKSNPVRRWGFLRHDLENLRWLDRHESLIAGM